MTKTDHARMALIIEQANKLMNVLPAVNPKVTNVDVIEAILGDIALIDHGWSPKHLAALIVVEGLDY
jgi:hypothetical protein